MATGTRTESSSLRAFIARILRFLDKLDWLALLILQVAVGYMFASGGWGKLHKLKEFGDWFGTLGIPFPHFNALFVASLEFVGGLCLIVGLGTRVFAFLLACTMVVALITVIVPGSEEKTLSDLIYKPESLLILICIVFMMMGPGKFSIDAFIRRKLGFTDESR